MRGRVKQFAHGYGFINTERGDSYFVHWTGIDAEGYKVLDPGEEVEFDITKSPKGPMAINVKKVYPREDGRKRRRG